MSLRSLLNARDLHGQSVLIVAVADIAAPVLDVRSSINNALRIVDVAIASSTSEILGVRNVSEIQELQSRVTRQILAGLSTDGDGITLLFVDHNVVAAT